MAKRTSKRGQPAVHDSSTTDRYELSLNEKLVLAHLRSAGQLPKAELARLTGLSATAIGSIVDRLEKNHFIKRGKPQKGKVGQPSIPYRLDPKGSYALGLKIGRRSCELILVNANREVVHAAEMEHDYPKVSKILEFARSGVNEILEKLGDRQVGRICGLGIAIPFFIWEWCGEMAVTEGSLDEWRYIDLKEAFGTMFGWPVHLANDATCACAAELAYQETREISDFLYIFVGWFIGGGIVLNGQVYEGRSSNAGALGSMPTSIDTAKPKQLIHIASLFTLERELMGLGEPRDRLWGEPRDWSDLGQPLEDWLNRTATGIAQAISTAASVVDFEAAIIDGSMPSDIRSVLVDRIASNYETLDHQGLSDILIREGQIGSRARAIGAACLPLFRIFDVSGNQTQQLSGSKV